MFNVSCRSFVVLSLVVLAACTPAAKNATPPSQKVALTEEQMMENWKKASTPGTEHDFLKKLAGTWSTKATFWKDPSAKPETSTGKAVNKIVLGGRFLQQGFKGKFMGMPFEGMGLVGYDNVKGSYISTWTDNMSTSIMNSGGIRLADNQALEMRGEFICPMTKEKHVTREVTKLIDKNQYVFEMYDVGTDGKEFKTMEIVYRKKS